MSRCPYCGNTDRDRGFTDPVPVCSGMPEGILVPLIQQCRGCGCTLSPAAFTPGTPKFRRARAMRVAAVGAMPVPA